MLTQIHHECCGAEAEYHIAGDAEDQSDSDHERVEAGSGKSMHEQGPTEEIIKIFK